MKNISVIGEKCYGCHGCEQSCPIGAISFRDNCEGFAYPVVDDACLSCGKCITVCPVMDAPVLTEPDVGYAAYLKDRYKLRRSSSGGLFVAVAEAVISLGGSVYGCGEKKPGYPCHFAVRCADELSLLQGSKYVQSDMEGICSQIKRELDQENLVLFTGTPCQIAGLRSFVGERDNLFTVDIICHGVPSRKMYRAYLEWLMEKHACEVKEFTFRSKQKHDWSLTYRAQFRKRNKTKVQEKIASLSPYYHHFLRAMDYRESCYICPFACKERVSDMTLGDFWGIEKVIPDFYNSDGVSAVLLNTQKGKWLWKQIQPAVVSESVTVGQIIHHNGQLRAPSQRPPERDEIYQILNGHGYAAVAAAYRDRRGECIDYIKNMIPGRVRRKIKAIIRHGR